MVELNNIYKKYGNNTVLDGINYTLPSRNVLGLMGENGAGKSTLLRCMIGLEKYQGSVRYTELDRCGYLPDSPFFYPYVKGYEYIEFCLKARNVSVTREEIDKKNSHLMLPLDKFCTSYSMGMKKRLVILMLMLQDNDIYIMDEPFNGLDLAGTLILKTWIKELKENGKTVIITSHIISSLTDICDRIIYIHGGKLVKEYVGEESAAIEDDIRKNFLSLSE